MKVNELYNNITESKTGLSIPVFISGKTLESKYNPERESDNLISTITESYNFFIVFGLGSGHFVYKLSEKFPYAKILVIENTNNDFLFLNQFEYVNKLRHNSNIIFSDICSFHTTLLNSYIPSLYGDIKIIERLPWKNENHEILPFIINTLNEVLRLISADYSVQCHFGKIWQHNILSNLKYLSKNPINLKITTEKKIAAIIAAGPSLDSKISYLKKKKSELYIISTDTALGPLLKNNIIPEIVVSIDGQHISQEHFFDCVTNTESTIFALDLCSNPAIVKQKAKYLFFNSGHPLSNIAATYANLPSLYSGAGTVTITALDLAIKLGFDQIQVIAADFSYRNGKPYAKGTYLDSIYGRSENKILPSEQLFTKLMFRTELKQLNSNQTTTTVLESYRKSFEEYLLKLSYVFKKEDDIYFVSSENNKSSKMTKINSSLKYSEFSNFLEKDFRDGNRTYLLPFISYLRNKTNIKNLEELENLAYSYFVSYNKNI